MKLYKISQDENNEYDTFDSAVVCAESEQEARSISPQCLWGHSPINKWIEDDNTWCSSPDKVQVMYLGEAVIGMRSQVICASFNAG